MQLPKSISPNPLFTSTIEIRFSTSLNRMELLQKMSSVFSNNFPGLLSESVLILSYPSPNKVGNIKIKTANSEAPINAFLYGFMPNFPK